MFLGIEIGGTKLQLGLGQGDGRITCLWRDTVDVAAGGEGIRRRIVTAVPELLAQADLSLQQLSGIGVGFGGPVDDATQSTIKSHQIDGWDAIPLAAWLTEQFGLAAALGNDADVAGLAEALFGAGKGLSPIFYITIGSGMGGGLIVEQKIYRGCGRGAAEIGHLRVPYRGSRVPLEDVASGWGIEKLARAAGQSWTAKEVGDRAAVGDPAAQAILAEAWEQLAEAICQVIALLCPKRIVIGGGVSLVGEKVLMETVVPGRSIATMLPTAS